MNKTLNHIREEYKRLQEEYYKPQNTFQRDYINGKIYAYHDIMIMLDSEERNDKNE